MPDSLPIGLEWTNFSEIWTKYKTLHLRISWWCHHMETFSALLAICAGNSPVPGEFPTQRPVTWSFDVFFDLRLNKQLSKQSWGWWFEMLSCPLWCHRNGMQTLSILFSLHWGWVMQKCVSKLAIIGSDNGLSPGQCQAIIWSNAVMLLIGPLGTNFNEILIKIFIFSFKKMYLKMCQEIGGH